MKFIMKKNILFLALISFVFTLKSQNIPSYIPMDSLIGYWGFDGDADDYSGNGNNGIVYGASLTEDRNGNPNSAFSFDGLDDYIITGNNQIPTDGVISISSWVKMDVSWGNAEFLSLGSSTSTTWGAIINTSQLRLNYGRGCSGTSADFANSQIKIGFYNHIVFVSNGANMLTDVYLNGDKVGSTINGSSGSCSFQNLYLGVDVFSSQEYLKGDIDDISVYNRALTESEIKAIYNENICTDTIQVMVYDTTYLTIKDTITYNDTNYVSINDTITYYDSVSVAVTDTLIINAEITGLNSPNSMNTLKVYPNPANDVVIIDNGDFSSMSDYKLKIVNSLGAEVFNSFVSIPQFQIPVSSLGDSGLYYIQIFDGNNILKSTKKLILE